MAKEKAQNAAEEIKASTVTFSQEQLEIVQKMIEASKGGGGNARTTISRYTDVRDPKKIQNVKVSRFDGKYVLGFKDLNKDPYRKEPKYSENKFDIHRKLDNQPFITLLLSEDGKEVEEKEVSLIDYMNNRTQVECKVKEIESKEIIEDKGVLGRQGSGGYATAIDANGNIEKPIAIKAEVKRVERVYHVEIPEFNKPVEFIEAFLA